MTNLLIRIKLAANTIIRVLSISHYGFRAMWYSLAILAILQWSFNIGILVAVVQNTPLEAPRFFIDGIINIFRYNDNFVSFGMITIAIMQGTALTLVRFIKDASRKTSKSANQTSVAFVLFGTGCVACGGSIIAPLLASLPATFSVVISRTVGNIAILIGLLLSLYSLISLGQKAAVFIKPNGGLK